MKVTTVTIRKLKGHASYYLRLVKAGHIVEITERSKPLARIIPVVWPLERRIEAARHAGLLSWNGQKPKPRAPGAKLRTKKTIAEIVIENRS